MQSPEKPTRLGTISFALAVLVIVIWCVYFIVFAATTEGGFNFGADAETAGYMVVLGGSLVMGVLTVLITLAGVITGILALRNKDPKRALAISGILLNFLCLAPYCLLLIFIAVSGMSFGP
ncbi:MAG: hypothetical protein IPG44_09165 [Anaerolineales bacterium]|jgi:hypothetical protein|nr:hypothetical protein [Chloroflexota bacterium]MBK6645909.1 hypothetical protein [Anaerolineales bacterium]MCC6984845.1 hypothetical protein [Anaerolineales bacterium]